MTGSPARASKIEAPGPKGTTAARPTPEARPSGIDLLQRSVGNRIVAELVAPNESGKGGALQRTVYHSGVGDLTYQADYAGWPPTKRAFTGDVGRIGYAKTEGIYSAILNLDAESDRQRTFAAIKVLADNQAATKVFTTPEIQEKVLDAFRRGRSNEYGVQPEAEHDFAHAVLARSGWFREAIARALGPLRAETGNELGGLYGRKRPPTASRDDPLDGKRMESELPPKLTKVLQDHDPGNAPTVSQPLDDTMRGKAGLIQQKAAAYFGSSGFAAHTWDGRPVVHGSWSFPGNVEELGTADVSKVRLPYLENRARHSKVGVLDAVGFSDSRPLDRAALTDTLVRMLEAKSMQEMVDRHVRNTPRTSAGKVWLQSTYQKVGEGSAALARAQWLGIRTMCHELLHVLSHPDFNRAEDRVEDSQVIKEGFVEVLGVELFNWILRAADGDPTLAKALTSGLAATDLPAEVPPSGLEYGDAATKAAAIQTKVGGQRFEAAFLLGRPDLVGIPEG